MLKHAQYLLWAAFSLVSAYKLDYEGGGEDSEDGSHLDHGEGGGGKE